MRASTKIYVASIVLLLGTLLACMAIGSPTWLENGARGENATHVSLGLWYACVDLECVSVHSDNGAVVKALGEWVYGAEASVTLGFVLYACGLLSILALYNLAPFHGHYHRLLHVFILNALGVALILGGTVLFGVMVEEKFIHSTATLHLSDAFYAACVSVGLGLATAIIIFIEYRDQNDIRRQYMPIN